MRAKRMKNMERTEGAEPSFNEIIDVSDDMRRRRGRRRKTVAMRVSAALLIVISICIGGFPAMLQYRSAHELSNASDRSARAVAGWPYPQADDAIAAAKEYNKRLAASGQPILGEAKDPFSQAQGSSRSSESGSNESDSASAKDTEYQSLLDSGSGGSMSVISIIAILETAFVKARFLFNSNILFLSVASATQNSICFAYCDCRLLANSIIFLL